MSGGRGFRVGRESERAELERYVFWAEENTRAGRAEPVDDVVLGMVEDGCELTLASIEAFAHIWGRQQRGDEGEEGPCG